MDEQPQSTDHDERAADAASIPSIPSTDGSESAEQQLALALRLLALQHSGEQAPRLLLGRLPDDLPLRLPLPPGAQVVGSLVHGQSIDETPVTLLATILVDAPLAGERVSEFYIEQLKALGWTFQSFHGGGFVSVLPGGFAHLRFTSPVDGYALMITAQPGHGSASAAAPETTLSIIVHRDNPQMAARRRGMGHENMRANESLIPTLMPPPGALQQGGGSGGGMKRWEANTRMESERPVAEVIAWYDRQLTRGGWTRRNGDASGPVGWSFWSLTDSAGEPWRGLLVTLSNPDHPSHYFVIVEVDAEG